MQMSDSSSRSTPNSFTVDENGWTSLHHAAKDGDVKNVARLLAAGISVDAKTKRFCQYVEEQSTALHVAAQKGHVEVVKALLDHGADIEASDKIRVKFDDRLTNSLLTQKILRRSTPLQRAAFCSCTLIVELLLFKGANVNNRNRYGETSLYYVDNRGNIDIIEALCAFGAKLNDVDHRNSTALAWMVDHARFSAIRLLLALNADTTIIPHGHATLWSLTDVEKITRYIVEHSKKPESERLQTRIETMRRIRNKVGVRLMRYAHDDIVGICLAFAPLELPPYVLLWIMDWLPRYDRLSHHTKIDLIHNMSRWQYCMDQLRNAAKRGNVTKLKRFLLEPGVDVTCERLGVYSLSILHLAADHGNVEVMRMLIDRGARVDAVDCSSSSPLHLACRTSERVAAVELLCFKGANIRARNRNGCTAIEFASWDGFDRTVAILVAFGADVDQTDEVGQTLLMQVAWRFNERCVVCAQLLLALNAATTLLDNRGQTCLQLALNPKIKQLLLEHGKKPESERLQTRIETMQRIRNKVGFRLMRYAQGDIVGICLAFAPLELPPYVLLWIMDWLPHYDMLSHHKKIHLIESVRASIWKQRGILNET